MGNPARLVLDETGHLCFLRDPYKGKAHDTSLADLTGDTLPVVSELDQDTGFQGLTLEGIKIAQPKNKPRRGELTPWSKRPIVRSLPSASISNRRSVECNAIGWSKTRSAS
jgi:hypothetical protein